MPIAVRAAQFRRDRSLCLFNFHTAVRQLFHLGYLIPWIDGKFPSVSLFEKIPPTITSNTFLSIFLGRQIQKGQHFSILLNISQMSAPRVVARRTDTTGGWATVLYNAVTRRMDTPLAVLLCGIGSEEYSKSVPMISIQKFS